ncbi:MAG: DUF554 domain-containing protein [Anaerolineae bacterium]|nr:DUF554 domain-containing protein [Anaerolineae bacterium]
MTGTFINIATVLVGTILGLLLGGRLNEKVKQTVMAGLGLVTIVNGIHMTLETSNILIMLGSVLVGGILGEWWHIEDGLNWLGSKLADRFDKKEAGDDSGSRFIRGFVTASLIFCVGPMTIIGSIQDGLVGDYRLLAIKSMLDGFAALLFASSLGIGVGFSTIVILIVQGGLSLLAGQAAAILTDPMIAEMTAAGGVLIMAIGVGPLLELKPIRVGNLLPALLLAPLIVWILTLLGIPLAPQF